MALIECSECKSNISEFAKMCPHCGFSELNTLQQPSLENAKQSATARIAQEVEQKAYSTMGCIAWGFIIFLILVVLGTILKSIGYN